MTSAIAVTTRATATEMTPAITPSPATSVANSGRYGASARSSMTRTVVTRREISERFQPNSFNIWDAIPEELT